MNIWGDIRLCIFEKLKRPEEKVWLMTCSEFSNQLVLLANIHKGIILSIQESNSFFELQHFSLSD